jgi:hypothetical protein
MPDQTNNHSKATTFVMDFARSLLPQAEIVFSNGQLRAASGGGHFSVPFTREDLDDLEPVLDGDLPTKYSDGMKSAIQSQIYLAKVMLEGKRD